MVELRFTVIHAVVVVMVRIRQQEISVSPLKHWKQDNVIVYVCVGVCNQEPSILMKPNRSFFTTAVIV